MSQDQLPHLYGAPDEANRQPLPEEGLRGERASHADRPEQERKSGDITIMEESGVAAATSRVEGEEKEEGS
jgi:hypothetical protein